MRIGNKWAALAVAHLVVVSCLAAGVISIAVRLEKVVEATRGPIAALPTSPPSDAEIARLNLLQIRIDLMQNNLANADTVGFKRQLVNVADGAQPRVSAFRLDLRQGALHETGEPTDLAVQGEGFFHVKIRPTVADGTAYTRNGMLQRNRNGDLIVAIGDGYPLIPAINIPMGAINISIEQDGSVTYNAPAMIGRKVAGDRINLCRFSNAQALGRVDGLYTETSESGPPDECKPGDNGTGVVIQGYLESSNVDPVKEWAALLRAQEMLRFTSQPIALRETGGEPDRTHLARADFD